MNCGQCLYTLTPPAPTTTSIFNWPTATPDPAQPTPTNTPVPIDDLLAFVPAGSIDVHQTVAYPGSDTGWYQPIPQDLTNRVVGIVIETRRVGTFQAGENFSLGARERPEGNFNDAFYIAGGSDSSLQIRVMVDDLQELEGVHPYWDAELAQYGGEFDDAYTAFAAQYVDDMLALSAWGVTNITMDAGHQQWWNEYEAITGNMALQAVKGQFVTDTFELRVLGWVGFNVGEPAPVLVQADYCAQVDDGLVGGGNGVVPELGIGLPVIVKGPAQCSGLGGVGPVDLPLVGEVSFPGIQVCFEPISFGHLEMFGLEINLDYMIFVLGCVMIIRWFLRS